MSLPSDPPASPWAPPSVGPVVPPPPPVEVVPGPPPAGPTRSKGKLIGGLVGVGALVAAGTFAVVKITGNDDRGGAASPEEVGTALTTALDGEDLLGVIDLLLPGERETFRQPVIDGFEHLRRLEVLSDDASLDDVGGIDITFSDVTVRSEPTNVDDVANIFLSGTSTVSVNGDDVPLGSLLIDDVFDGERPDMNAEPDTSEFDDTKLTVVEEDGRWYLSAFFSLAESLRGDRDIPDEGVTPAGADTPEGAVDALLGDVADLDLEGVIADLDPTEMQALQRYAPLFLDDAQSAIDGSGLEWRISDTELTVDGSGDRRSVDVGALRLDAWVEGTEVSLELRDGCVEVTVDGDSQRTCPGDSSSVDDALDELPDEVATSARGLVDTLQDAMADYDAPGIAVHQVDGRWFVSPLRSVSDQVDAVLDALDADELRAIIDAARDAAGEFSSAIDDAFGIDPTDVIDEGLGVDGGGSDDGGSDGGFDTGDGTLDALSACYDQTDAAAGVQCMQDGIANGTIDPTFVAVPIREAQCGVAEQYWNGLFELTDEEFTALVTEASPCFLDLVASGEVSAYEVPDELIAPQCVEGRNWYTVFDDEAYSTRVFDCAAAVRDSL